MVDIITDTSLKYFITINNTMFSICCQIRPKKPLLKLGAAPDDDLKEKLVKIFVQITEGQKEHAEKLVSL